MPLCLSFSFFFFNDTATTEIYTLSLHDALPIWRFDGNRSCPRRRAVDRLLELQAEVRQQSGHRVSEETILPMASRSEEHTSELQSLAYLVCRLLLEKKKPGQRSKPKRHSTTPAP